MKVLITALILGGLAFVVGSSAGAHLDGKQAGSLLAIFGVFFTLATGIIGNTLKKSEESLPKDLSSEKRRNELERQLEKLRIRGWKKWGVVVSLGIITALIGWALFYDLFPGSKEFLTGIGSVMILTGVVLVIRSIREYLALAKTLRDVSRKLEEQKRRNAALGRLRGHQSTSG